MKSALKLVNSNDLVLDERDHTAFLKKKGMAVGLGGIAKGYAIGRVAELIKKAGFKDFALRAGVDIFV